MTAAAATLPTTGAPIAQLALLATALLAAGLVLTQLARRPAPADRFPRNGREHAPEIQP